MLIMSIPSEYRRIEYLESTEANGFPYIFLPNVGTTLTSGKKMPSSKGEYKIKMRRYNSGEIRIMGFGSDEYSSESTGTVPRNCCNVIGGSASTETYIASVNYGCHWIDITRSEAKVDFNPVGSDLDIDYIFEPRKQTLIVNGMQVQSSRLNQTFNPYSSGYKGFYLFRVNDAMKVNRMKGSTRIYYAKVYEDGVLKADLVPVANGAVGYMWDYVSDKAYGNSGSSGSFDVGPEVCKFKDPTNNSFCKVIQGYCQYQRNGFESGLSCGIREGHKNLSI